MGAPGHYILCGKGHEIGMIEDDLYWDEEMFKRLEELEKKKCPICGGEAKYNFCHYGNINDCTDVKLTWNDKEKRWIIPKKLEERQKKDLKDHIIKKDRIIKTEKVKKIADEGEDMVEKVDAEKITWIDGTEISQMRCGQFEDNLDVKVGKEIYMLNAASVLRMANEFKFSVVQKNGHKYLVPVEKFGDIDMMFKVGKTQPENVPKGKFSNSEISKVGFVAIRDLRAVKLTSLKGMLSDAVVSKKPVKISINSNDPEEILKGTYVAGILSKQGYSCNAQILNDIDEIDWTCKLPE